MDFNGMKPGYNASTVCNSGARPGSILGSASVSGGLDCSCCKMHDRSHEHGCGPAVECEQRGNVPCSACAGAQQRPLLATTSAALDQCRSAFATLRSCARAATSRLDSCCALLRATGAAMAALDQAFDATGDVNNHQLRQLHFFSAAMLATTYMAVARVQVSMTAVWRVEWFLAQSTRPPSYSFVFCCASIEMMCNIHACSAHLHGCCRWRAARRHGALH